MKVIHYTKENDFQIRPIYIKNSDLRGYGYWCKPQGGIWASPVGCNYGWKKWNEEHSFESIDEMKAIEMDIDIDKFIVINNSADLDKLHWQVYIPGFRIESIDFEKMVGEGIEGIYLTEKGEMATRFPYISKSKFKFRNLYGWDCETILIMNEICIKSLISLESL